MKKNNMKVLLESWGNYIADAGETKEVLEEGVTEVAETEEVLEETVELQEKRGKEPMEEKRGEAWDGRSRS